MYFKRLITTIYSPEKRCSFSSSKPRRTERIFAGAFAFEALMTHSLRVEQTAQEAVQKAGEHRMRLLAQGLKFKAQTLLRPMAGKANNVFLISRL